MLGNCTEGRNYVRAALALPAIRASDLAQAHALYVGAVLADAQSDYGEARRMLEACLVLRRGLGDPVEIATPRERASARPKPANCSNTQITVRARRSVCCILDKSRCTCSTMPTRAFISSSALS